jgi:hypothetical protein
MAQQKHGGKPSFKSFASATGGGKKKERVKRGVAKASKRARKKEKKDIQQNPLPFASGYCATRCGVCISCKIAKGDEDNKRRIEKSQRSDGSFSYGWGRRFD